MQVWQSQHEHDPNKVQYNINLNRRELKVLHKLKTDFTFFFENAIKIEGKEPGSVYGWQAGEKNADGTLKFPNEKKLTLNSAQLIFINHVFDMLKRTGMVRIIVVKGRQQGISTIIEMLFLWLAVFVPHTKICIVAHETKASAAIFKKVEFAHKNLPTPIKPGLLVAQTGKTLEFDNGSTYIVLTAGSEETGRSQTAHHKHESERAFFDKPDIVDAGVGQIIPDIAGTFDFKESSGNGHNHFYVEVVNAVNKLGNFEVCFIPFFLQTEYRTKPAEGFVREEDEQKLVDQYGVDDWQLQWRRDKIVYFKNNVRKFKQEYPFFLMEAFQMGANSYYDPDDINRARKSTYISNTGARVLGVDPARGGASAKGDDAEGDDKGRTGDRTIICYRRGREVKKYWEYGEMTETRLAGILKNLIDELEIDKCFIDTGHGWGTIDILHDDGYKKIVSGVSFAEASDDPQYANKRAEMFGELGDWLGEAGNRLPDSEPMAADLASIPPPTENSSGKILFMSKKDIVKKIKRSPDYADATILTFARKVRAPKDSEKRETRTSTSKKGSPLTTISKLTRRKTGTDNKSSVSSKGMW